MTKAQIKAVRFYTRMYATRVEVTLNSDYSITLRNPYTGERLARVEA